MTQSPSILESLINELKQLAEQSRPNKNNTAVDLQGFWEELLTTAHTGMNIGVGEGVTEGERFVIGFLRERMPSERVIFDVGANTGEYSEILAAAFPSPSRIFSFEPSAKLYEALKNRTKNLSNVKCFKTAISSKNGTAEFFSDCDASPLGSLHKRRLEHFKIDHKSTETVPTVTLDQFCSENGINRIDFLKLDVEGHELEVLKGAERLLSESAVRAIQFEFGGTNIDARTFFQDFYYLLSPTFDIFRILPNGLYPISTYRERLEIFQFSNFLALLRQ